MDMNAYDLVDFGVRCDSAIATGNAEQLHHMINILDSADIRKLEPIAVINIQYMLGNLYTALSSASNEKLSTWRTGQFPEHRVSSINLYRKAIQTAHTVNHPLIAEISTNLANSISEQGRVVEALAIWDCDFSKTGDASFVSALAKVRTMLWMSHYINDLGHADCYRVEAYKLLSVLDKNISKNDHPSVYVTVKEDAEMLSFLEYGQENFQNTLDWDNSLPAKSYGNPEKRYRLWCLKLGLFCNDLNDLTPTWIADRDILQFPNYRVKIGNGPFLAAAFSAIKREYCFARFLAYEGVNGIHPKYENNHLFVTDSYDGVEFDGSIEKLKTAFRVSFSALDSIANLLNQYFKCGANKAQFSSLWIKNNLHSNDNPFIDALYWLACDIQDLSSKSMKNWKAPNPDSAELRRLRNSIEHGWLRVVSYESERSEENDDYAHIVSSDNMCRMTIDTLRLTRAAMQYVCFAVKYEEDRRTQNETDSLCIPLAVPLWKPR
ncbi:MAG: LA2681 family HEPN domain-containing protein [Arenicella sp.]